jgi:hypothetical protein
VKITMQLFPDWVTVAVGPVTVEMQLPEPIADAVVGATVRERRERRETENIRSALDFIMG